MSEAYERERQNNSRLDELASKITSLRDVTINIYDNARDHELIDNSNEVFSNFTTGLKQSAGRITRMAATGSRGQTMKLAGMIAGGVIVLYLIWGWVF